MDNKIKAHQLSLVSGAMVRVGDEKAVVDTHGRVFGVHGLRVADISAFPLLPPGHPQSNVCEKRHCLNATNCNLIE